MRPSAVTSTTSRLLLGCRAQQRGMGGDRSGGLVVGLVALAALVVVLMIVVRKRKTARLNV
jgi:hypothetical protein